MTDMLTQLRDRIESRIEPHVSLYGDDAPVVRMARLILADAEQIAEALAEQWLPTAEVAARTGWRVETLQRQARAVLDGDSLRGHWKGLQVREGVSGYEFMAGSVPKKRESAA